MPANNSQKLIFKPKKEQKQKHSIKILFFSDNPQKGREREKKK